MTDRIGKTRSAAAGLSCPSVDAEVDERSWSPTLTLGLGSGSVPDMFGLPLDRDEVGGCANAESLCPSLSLEEAVGHGDASPVVVLVSLLSVPPVCRSRSWAEDMAAAKAAVERFLRKSQAWKR